MNHTIQLERMSYGPDAIGHLPDGKTVFVEGGAPGDIVELQITDDRASFSCARIVAIKEPSANRIAPLSAIDQVCGTAPWQHLAYEAQLEAKRTNIVGALVHTARFPLERAEDLVGAVLPSKRTWNYRNKLELGVGKGADGKLILGFHPEGSSEVVSAESSHLAHSKIEKAPKALRGAMRFAQGDRDLGIFRVGVRHSLATGELEIALWTRPGAFPRNLFAKTLGDALKPSSIVRVLADPGKARKIKGVETLAGRGYWRERIGEAEFSTQAPSFFQVNTAQAGKLVDIVIDRLNAGGGLEGAYVADLYAGGGTFSIALANAGADVVAVESAGSSVRDLRFNAEANDVFVEVVGGDAARELTGLGELDALVVDPPRSGLAESVVSDIAVANPALLAYVSCNPSTWARDIARFEEHGYQLVEAVPVDMFPQTYHVEVASFLRRR